MIRLAILLSALLALAVPARPADFAQTLTGEAPLRDGEDAASCQRAAELQLESPRAKLEGQCEQDGGQFNYGFVSPSYHRDSCTVYQPVTCSGTGAPAQARQEAGKPVRADDADLPPALRRALEQVPSSPARGEKRKAKKRKKPQPAKTAATESNG